MEILGLYVPSWVLLFLLLCYLIYVYLTWRFGELKALGISHPPPKLLKGNLDMLMGKPGLFKMDIALRQQYGDIFGLYIGRVPTIVVADVDIIKQILVKDFNNFVNRRRMMLKGIFKYGLFDAMDDHWKHLRRLSSPAFSSGKFKKMHHHIKLCAEQLTESLQQKAEKRESFEVKDVCSAFAMDVIAATVFGLQLDSQKDVKNPFNVNGKKFFDQSLNLLRKLEIYLPDLIIPFDRLGVHAGNKEATQFFTDMLKQAIKERQESDLPANRMDFLQLMMEGKSLLDNADEEVKQQLKEGSLTPEPNNKEKDTGMTEKEIMAQSLLFLLAGYENIGTTLAFACYLLAAHPDVQDKILKEIQGVWNDKEELEYEDVKQLKYMDMCIEETLRLYPPAARVDRRARKEVTYKNLTIPKDYQVVFPIMALHHDQGVWPEPEKFDPERFSSEAKACRNPYYYMPFGMGPRNCIGMRLALLELKLALATVIQKYHLTVSSNCQEPLELENTFKMRVKGGIWLNVETRQ